MNETTNDTTTKTHSLKISDITISNRQRFDYGDIGDLADSLQRHGLIQPIVVNQERRLIAGGRRLAAAQSLGWDTIQVVYKETLSSDVLHELELEENIKRKEMTWQERTLAISFIHSLKRRRAALESSNWGLRETADLLGVKGYGNLSYTLQVAEALAADTDKTSEVWSCQNLQDAVDLVVLKARQNALTAELARRHVEQTKNQQAKEISTLLNDLAPDDKVTQAAATKLLESGVEASSSELQSARERYYSNPLNPPGSFEDYWSARQKDLEEVRNTIYLSNRLYKGDAVEALKREELQNRFPCIVTDPPYGIDMEMLNQQNPHGGMKDINEVAKLHDVDYNFKLLEAFFPLAYNCLRENGFLVLWADQMLWQFLYDQATKAGFKVQRWPFLWVKTGSCMNQSANTNLTKCTEIAVVCRKGVATLSRANIPNYISCGQVDDITKKVDHPFAKPFEAWKALIDAVSIKGQEVLDPFMGKGSCALSSIRLDRLYVGVELEENFYNAALENVKQEYLKTNPKARFK